MAWYRAGTITSAGNVITGVGTKWLDNKMGIGAGQILLVPGDGMDKMYEILAVDSDTKLRLVATPSPVISGAYAIISFYNDSVPDFARRLAAQLSYYQSQMDGWQKIITGTGNVTIIAPDGTSVVIPAFSSLVTKQQFDTLSNDAFTASKIVATPWINLTLQNGWKVTGGGYRAVYRKVLGLVFVEATMDSGSLGSGNLVIFTLPAGYRPTNTMVVPSAAAGVSTFPANVIVRTNGEVQITGVTSNQSLGLAFNFAPA
ncbi:hypothetical protein [Yersinia kristensenii]|uniref:hypothetical protein n=1 Tax=Yersinia kristensenii TaxID=28152 RepID=UPI0011A1942C|nr:hypothetical protein [Yersinia kristensenii]